MKSKIQAINLYLYIQITYTGTRGGISTQKHATHMPVAQTPMIIVLSLPSFTRIFILRSLLFCRPRATEMFHCFHIFCRDYIKSLQQ